MNYPVTPTDPLPHNDDPDFESLTDDFERTFFDGAEQVSIPVTLMRETWDTLHAVIEQNGWAINEGLVILMTVGMAFLRAERALAIVAQGADDLSGEEVKKLLDRLSVIEARYASIKSFAFSIMRDHRTLEMRFAPLEREHGAFRRMVGPLRDENEQLKREVARLKRELEEATQPPDVMPAPRSDRPSWWKQLLNKFTGRKVGPE